MNSKHAFLALSVFTLVSIAHGEREVFAPTKLAPVVDAGTIRLDNGTAGVPSLSFKSDTDTGLYRNGANTLSLSTNAVGKFHVTSSTTPTVVIGDEPNISGIPLSGILRATSGSGTNIAGGNLTIQGGNSTGNAAGGYVAFQTAAAGAAGATNNTLTERMRIDSTGLVGIGTTPSVLLDVLNPSAAASSEVARFRGDTASTPYIGFFNGANRTGYIQYSATSLFVGADTNKNIQITTTGTGDILQNTGGSERMRITSAGNVVVGNGETAASVANGNIRATGGSGTNINGADLVLHGGQSTGTASGGALRFFTAPAGGVSGTSVNASTERMRIDSAGDVYIGNGLTAASPTAGTIRGTSGSGTNIAGAGLVVAPGQGTGSGAGGPFRVLTAPAGTSGSSLNGLVERVRVKQGGQVRFVPLAAAPTLDVEDGDVYYNSTTNKLQVRAAGVWVDLH